MAQVPEVTAHLGHNRSVEDVVRAALQEDADAIRCRATRAAAEYSLAAMVEVTLAERGAGYIRRVRRRRYR